TTGDLHDQLGHALAGAKIRGKQPAIGVEDGYQGHAREVMPLGEHLRAHQQAGFATIDNPQELLHRAFARSAVAVDAQDREIWKENAQTLFGSLGTGPHRAQVDPIAFGAAQWRSLGMAAVVTAQLVVALVQGHARIATRALAEPAAVVAQQGRSESAAIEEYQNLLTGGEGLRHGLLQRPGDA